MKSHSHPKSSNPSVQLAIFAVSLIDDAVILGGSQIGLHLRWLHWLSPVILVGMFIYISLQILDYLCQQA
ncbi:hypothetical protein [Calothrix sp. NIES-3974]|uniref:hypothetical protein n=1 Tax=Calothrix sp. NIES-3974 TaxID=2005462 RepID=UPI000B60AF1A|nr:hypothetical protein [Calothrix sp. NIES-3974]BAZ05660.1 hypothetical protein NIES3974_23120 [Calothrix sp. NIES-3974]